MAAAAKKKTVKFDDQDPQLDSIKEESDDNTQLLSPEELASLRQEIHTKVMRSILADNLDGLEKELARIAEMDAATAQQRAQSGDQEKRSIIEYLLHQPLRFPELDFEASPELALPTLMALQQIMDPTRSREFDRLTPPEQVEVAQRFVQKYQGGTPMHIAASLRRVEAVKLLYKAGGKLSKKVKDVQNTWTPAEVCYRKDRTEEDLAIVLYLHNREFVEIDTKPSVSSAELKDSPGGADAL